MSKKKGLSQLDQTAAALLSRRTVVLSGEITHDSIKSVRSDILTLQTRSSDRINLIIDSRGGQARPALQLCDLITSTIVAPIRGIVMGSCGSAATFVLLCCTERLSTPYSDFLIHSGHRHITLYFDHLADDEIGNVIVDIKRMEELGLRLYMDRLTPSAWAGASPSDDERRAYVRQLIARGDRAYDSWMLAEEAVEVGLVTDIVHEKLDIFSS